MPRLTDPTPKTSARMPAKIVTARTAGNLGDDLHFWKLGTVNIR